VWPHFSNLFWRTVLGMPKVASSGWITWGLGFVSFMLYEINSLRSDGWNLTLWKQTKLRKIIEGLVIVIITYLILFGISGFITVYDDHHDSTGRWKNVVNEKNRLVEELQKRDSYITLLEGRSCPACTTPPTQRTRISTQTPIQAPVQTSGSASPVTETPPPVAAPPPTPKELADRALQFISKLRRLHDEREAEYDKELAARTKVESSPAPDAVSQLQRQAKISISRNASLRADEAVMREYRNYYATDAKVLRGQLRNALHPGCVSSETESLYETSVTPNMIMIGMVADDLERMAKLLQQNPNGSCE
jgi:hypothetical protein